MKKPDELPKAYDPTAVEDAIYAAWEASGVFNPDELEKKDKRFNDGVPYCIAMPPPNRTGTLHIGHSVMLAIEDLLIRFHRMRGRKALWIPGTDHAAISTQVKVEQLLIKEGMKDPRKELGREKFLERVVAFAEKSATTMRKQIRKMGSSCDWSRERYTLDEPRNRAVNEVFKMMYDDGIIERGYRIVNWDPKFQTTLSDDEVLAKETTAKMLTFAYDKDFPIIISTTRPETKFGDTAVAVHPDDPRYKQYVGKTLTANYCGKQITVKVIADEAVDPEFGTGALGVTPAHSMIDADIAQRHGLPTVVVIGKDGRMLPEAGEAVAGLTVVEAREKIEKMLKEAGLLKSVEEIPQNLPIAERGGTPVEQLPMVQWFIRVNKPFALRQDTLGKWKKGDQVTLKELMIHAVESGQTKIIPERFNKIYFNWINNLRDWCISRQIWFGHSVPMAYDITDDANSLGIVVFKKPGLDVDMKIMGEYRNDDAMKTHPVGNKTTIQADIFSFLKFLVEKKVMTWQELKAKIESYDVGSCYGKKRVVDSSDDLKDGELLDPDTLDTWFSSGLWTFSTLGWPDKNEWDAHREYHPTAVLETAYDILFFWVARMILMTTYVLGEVPFHDVYLHGLIRDEQGRKMSKSLGNVLDPLDLIPKYGTDAVRLSLVLGTTPGQDSKSSEAKVEGFRNFTNKLWNISRFILMQVGAGSPRPSGSAPDPKTLADGWILARLDEVTSSVTKKIEKYEFSSAGEELRDFTWGDLADWYLEIAKVEKEKDAILLHILQTILKLWHPFMPFVTEHVWEVAGFDGDLIISEWPSGADTHDSRLTTHDFELLRTLVTDLRRLRAEQGIETGKMVEAAINADDAMKKLIESNIEIVKSLARASDIRLELTPDGWATAVSGTATIGINVAGAVDVEKENAKLAKELAEAEAYIASTKAKLENAEFTSKAPEKVVEGMKAKLAEAEGRKEAIAGRMKSL